MNQEQLISLLRQALLFGGGIAVGKGWVDQTTMVTIVAGLIALATAIWGQYARSNTALIASAEKLPEVSRIVTTDAIAAKFPNSDTVVDLATAKATTPPDPVAKAA